MLSFQPPSPEAEVEPATVSFEMPPSGRLWLVLAGLALPFAAVAVGWWVADSAAAGRQDDGWWEEAGGRVFLGVVAALGAAAWCCLPVFRRIREASQVVLALVLGSAYLVLLFLVNLCVYMKTSGPFP